MPRVRQLGQRLETNQSSLRVLGRDGADELALSSAFAALGDEAAEPTIAVASAVETSPTLAAGNDQQPTASAAGASSIDYFDLTD